MNIYVKELLIGLFFAATIVLAALASGLNNPFIYQGF